MPSLMTPVGNEQQYKWQRQIKMFFDRQTPSMREWRQNITLQMQKIWKEQREQLSRWSERPIQDVKAHHRYDINEIRWPDFEGTSNKKPANIQRGAPLPFFEEQPTNEKPAKYEKEINPRPAKVESNLHRWCELPGVGVTEGEVACDDQEHGNSPQKVELREARYARPVMGGFD